MAVELREDVGKAKRACVKIGQVRTLSTERLGRRIGRASPEILEPLEEGLNETMAA